MSKKILAHIQASSKYHELKRRRSGFANLLCLLMLIVYFGFIGLIAFNKEFLSQPLGTGVTTIGIPIGIAVILFTILVTAIYVYRANGKYDTLTKEILQEAHQLFARA